MKRVWLANEMTTRLAAIWNEVAAVTTRGTGTESGRKTGKHTRRWLESVHVLTPTPHQTDASIGWRGRQLASASSLLAFSAWVDNSAQSTEGTPFNGSQNDATRACPQENDTLRMLQQREEKPLIIRRRKGSWAANEDNVLLIIFKSQTIGALKNTRSDNHWDRQFWPSHREEVWHVTNKTWKLVYHLWQCN